MVISGKSPGLLHSRAQSRSAWRRIYLTPCPLLHGVGRRPPVWVERSLIWLFSTEYRFLGLVIMDQEIDQPIDVIAVFQKGSMVPVRFRWNGKVIKIARVTGRWKSSERRFRIKHFAVTDKNSQSCQLSYKERIGEWFLDKIWME